jgi:septal ring factor EnvC (AmiA/AmiB activator)
VFSNLVIRIGGNALEFAGQFTIDEVRDVVAAFLANIGGQSDATAIAQLQADVAALKEADVTQKDNLAALATRLDTATNTIAAELTELRGKIADGTVSDADLAPLDANIAKLEGLGADPSDPVPGDGETTDETTRKG